MSDAAATPADARTCAACGDPLRSDNRSGICALCRKANVSTSRCACGCGALLDVRNRSGFARPCYPRALAAAARELITHRSADIRPAGLSDCREQVPDEFRGVTR